MHDELSKTKEERDLLKSEVSQLLTLKEVLSSRIHAVETELAMVNNNFRSLTDNHAKLQKNYDLREKQATNMYLVMKETVRQNEEIEGFITKI